jgi:hypothetical protein
MSLIKVVRQGAVTLPAVAVVDRKSAWRSIRAAQESVRWLGPGPRPDPEQEERQTYAIVGEARDGDA